MKLDMQMIQRELRIFSNQTTKYRITFYKCPMCAHDAILKSHICIMLLDQKFKWSQWSNKTLACGKFGPNEIWYFPIKYGLNSV